jgi:hypothetical protein
MRRRRRQTFGNVIANWRRDDLTLSQKLRMQLENSWLRIKRRSNCCGNDGEPGC